MASPTAGLTPVETLLPQDKAVRRRSFGVPVLVVPSPGLSATGHGSLQVPLGIVDQIPKAAEEMRKRRLSQPVSDKEKKIAEGMQNRFEVSASSSSAGSTAAVSSTVLLSK